MFKVLMKKQMKEVKAIYFRDKKTGNMKTGSGMTSAIILYAVLAIVLAVVFTFLSVAICVPAHMMGNGWIYFALISLIAMVVGVIGSVGAAFSGIFQAKDNDLLLAMPIRPRTILLARIFSCWIVSDLFEVVVMVPALVVYYIMIPQTVASVICSLLTMILLSLLILAITVGIGWLVSLIASKMKYKKFGKTFVALAAFLVYFIFIFRSGNMISAVTGNIAATSEFFEKYLWFFYQLGRGAEGEIIPFLIFAGISIGVFLGLLALMSYTFLGIATAEMSGAQAKSGKQAKYKQQGIEKTLFQKDLKGFVSSSTYFLNCGIGSILIILLAIILLINRTNILPTVEGIKEMLSGIRVFDYNFDAFISAAVLTVACFVASICTVAAPSISMETKTLWLLRSLPIDRYQILKSKMKLQMVFAIPAVLFFILCSVIVFMPAPVYAIAMFIGAILFPAFNASFCMKQGVKHPILHWTSETAAVKQGAAVTISLFGSWGFSIILIGLFFLLLFIGGSAAAIWIYLAFIFVLLLLNIRWLKNKGTIIFENIEI